MVVGDGWLVRDMSECTSHLGEYARKSQIFADFADDADLQPRLPTN